MIPEALVIYALSMPEVPKDYTCEQRLEISRAELDFYRAQVVAQSTVIRRLLSTVREAEGMVRKYSEAMKY